MENHRIVQECEALIEQGSTTGVVVAYGDSKKVEYVCSGLTGEKGIRVSVDTGIDLASITKLFTSLLCWIMQEEGRMDFCKSVGDYSRRFANLSDVSIEDLLGFYVEIRTPVRIEGLSGEESMAAIYAAKVARRDRVVYSDIPHIVLGLLLEEITGVPLGEMVEERIFKPLGMSRSYYGRCMDYADNRYDYSHEYWYVKGELVDKDCGSLTPHDSKARVLGKEGEALIGHSGIYSCGSDLARFAQGLLQGELISKESFLRFCSGQSKRSSDEEQSFGYGYYKKHPVENRTEVYHGLDDLAIGSAGFTGTYLTIDPVNDVFVFIGGNRVNYRVTKTDEALNGRKLYHGSHRIKDSSVFYLDRDRLRKVCCDALLNKTGGMGG